MAERHPAAYFLALWGVVLAIGIALGMAAIFTTSLIPREALRPTVEDALATFEEEGLYPQGPPAADALATISIRDNFSDSVFVNLAFTEEPGLAGSLSVPLWTEGESPLDWLSGALARTAAPMESSTDGGSLVPYARYWHGHLVYLRPLLASGLPYEVARSIPGLVALGLFCAAMAIFIARRLGYVVPLLLASLLLSASWLLPFSIHYANVMLVGAASVFVISLFPRRFCAWSSALGLAMAVGVATAFFDAFTFPLLAIGLTVIVLCVLRRGEGLDRGGALREAAFAVTLLLGWACAWASMWVAKWCIANLVLGIDVIGDALGTAQMRTGATTANGTESIGRLDALRRSASTFLGSAFECGTFVVTSVGYGIWDLVLRVRSRGDSDRSDGNFLASLLPYACVALATMLWCVVLANHTYQHIFMTYRTFTLVPLALVGWLAGYGASLLRTPRGEASETAARHLSDPYPSSRLRASAKAR